MQAEPTQHFVAIDTPEGAGDASVLEWGPADRPVDIVFSHANGFNALTYRTILQPLADAGLRVLVMDQRGHGRSRLPAVVEGRTSWTGLADDLIAVLDALGVKNAVLAGHSMGGTISLFAAARRPDLVKALGLFDPVVMGREMVERARSGLLTDSPLVLGAQRRRTVFADRAAVIASYTGKGAFRTWSPEMLADYVEAGFRDRPDGEVELTCAPAWEASNFSTHAHDPWAAFAASRCPIRILKAETGSTCSAVEGELTADGRIRIETIPGTSHFLPMEVPERVRMVLRELVAG
jgi:pimeloyl-ACP methyl ester carboxylesterase